MRKGIIVLIVFTLVTIQQMVAQELSLNAIFSNGMVLQQNSNVKIWGKASPGETISINANWGETVQTLTGNNGRWETSIPTHKAGGPYSLSIAAKHKTITITDILLGELWLCSGQSNMEMPLSGWPPLDTIRGSANAIAHARNSLIRIFTVQRAASLHEELECKGQWEESTPENASHFSATAFFYAQKLYNELHVPIGIIHSSWGGTAIEAWIGSNALSNFPDFTNEVKKLEALKPQQQKYNDWLLSHKTLALKNKPENEKWTNLEFNDISCSKPQTDDNLWPTITLPCASWETKEIGEFDGVVWFRRSFELPASMVGTNCILHIPGIDDMDRVYINGTLVGATEIPGYWLFPRKYNVPSSLLKEGKNNIAIRVLDNQGGGGIGSTKTSFKLTSVADTSKNIDLSGQWKYTLAAEYKNGIFYLLNVSKIECLQRPKVSAIGTGTITALYNAMINPIIPYTIKGVLWYQGETNVGRAKQYESLLPLLVTSWRESWNQESFPFYIVQIAPWTYSGGSNIESAELRNAQRKAADTIKNSGLVVTLDLGDSSSIHPGKKKEVGERLALWALSKDYGKSLVCSGPLYKSSKVTGNKIEITFMYADNGLKLSDTLHNGFQIAGVDKIFKNAQVEITGNKVIISNDVVTAPRYVRYAYLNTSKATLYNIEGLPASTFTTE